MNKGIEFQNIDLALFKRLLRERPFAVLAVLSLAGCVFVPHGNTFSAGQMMTTPLLVGGCAGFVLALSAALRDPEVAERRPMLFDTRNALFYAIQAAVVAGLAAILLSYAVNRWIPAGSWQWRELQVKAVHRESGRFGLSETAFINEERCCLGLSGTDYGGVGARVEFRMRRGLLGYWVYSEYRHPASPR
ncbi:MAG: hypothetical protein K2Y31_04910 [Burkholderiales bacterium]|nr:hypothetical protein [Burkholderiales bacterium]